MVYEKFLKIGEYAASGAFEEPERSLFYRKALGIRRFYENCPLCEYRGERLYPSGVFYSGSAIYPYYLIRKLERDEILEEVIKSYLDIK